MEKKYIPLASFFRNSSSDEIKLTYSEIENIMGQQLPNAAYLNVSWWKKKKAPFSHFEAWVNAGYFVASVIIGSEVTFSRVEGSVSSNHKDHDIFIIREIEMLDARHVINLKESIYAESKYHVFYEGEFQLSVQSLRKQLTEQKKLKSGMTLLGIVNGKLAGYVEINRYLEPRNHHVASLQFGVLQIHQNKGVGRALLVAAEDWASQLNISRLEATVVEEHEIALKLLTSNGFQAEGIRKNAYLLNENYLNELYMYKLI